MGFRQLVNRWVPSNPVLPHLKGQSLISLTLTPNKSQKILSGAKALILMALVSALVLA